MNKHTTKPWRTATVAIAVLSVLGAACAGTEASLDDNAQPAVSATSSLPAQPASDESVEPDNEPEFIELAYWEGVLAEGFNRTVQPPEECDDSDPALLVCTFDQSVHAVATQIGSATDTSTGTITTYLAETCDGTDGSTGTPVVLEGSGSMETAWGDELHFRNRRESCQGATIGPGLAGAAYLVFDGGTGRFEDAYGTASIVNPVLLGAGFLSVGVGTLMVRADLWQDHLPQ